MKPDPDDPILFHNASFVPLSQARISPLDRGFLYGDGVFETLRVYGKRLFRFEDHAERLAASAAALRIPLPCSARQMREAILALLEANGLSDASARIAVSRGVGLRGPSLRGEFRPTIVIMVSPFQGYPANWCENGIHVIASRVRVDASSPLPSHKTANYLTYILARAEAEDAGAQEALLLNSHGHVAEASTANVFLVEQGRVVTPSTQANILPGVTRKVVLELARARRLPVEECLFGLDRLLSADEVFLTNSLMEIMPVTSMQNADRRLVFSDGRPGALTRALAGAYRALIREL